MQNGVELEGQNGLLFTNWKLDTTQDPIYLDIIQVFENGDTITTLAILRFIDENTIQIRTSEDDVSRPLSFMETDDDLYQITLPRAQ